MEIPELITSRLILRAWQPGDADALYRIVQEPGILDYFPRTTPPPPEWPMKYINHHQEHWRQRGYGHWAVTLRETGQVIGWNGLEFLPETQETEVAYLLSHAFWGQGLATEAAKAAVVYGLETARLDFIIGLVHPLNIGSQRVLEKSGLAFTHAARYFGMELWRYIIRQPKEPQE